MAQHTSVNYARERPRLQQECRRLARRSPALARRALAGRRPVPAPSQRSRRSPELTWKEFLRQLFLVSNLDAHE
eukprot:3961423-Pyramimonas_sp.AAC.1